MQYVNVNGLWKIILLSHFSLNSLTRIKDKSIETAQIAK